MMIKKEWMAATVVAAVIFGCAAYLGATNVTKTYSDSDAANIGAWYDELWNATECYQTKKDSDTEVVFAHKEIDSLPASNPTLVYDTGAATVSLPSRTAITKWKVTGHVHFPNN